MRYRDLFEDVNRTPWTFYHGTDSEPFDQFAPKNAAKGDQYWNPLGNGMYVTDAPRFANNFGKRVHKVIIPPGYNYKRINLRDWQTSVGFALTTKALRIAMKACGESYDHWEKGVPEKGPNFNRMTDEQLTEFCLAEYAKWGKSEEELNQIRERAKTVGRDVLLSSAKNIVGRTPRKRDEEKAKKIREWRYDVSDVLRRNSPYEGLYESAHVVGIIFGQEIMDAYEEALPKVSDAHFSRYDFIVFTETNDVIGLGKDGNSALEVVIFNPELQRTVANT